MLPAIENGFTFIAFLMFLAGGLLAMEKYTKWKVFNWVPPLVWIYILNMVFCTLGLYNSEGVSAAYGVLKNNLLYAMIFVMLLRCDFRKIAKLSGRMIAIFLGCSITLALGFIVGFPIFKGSLGGGETIWGATAALYASWVGGSANMAAMQDGCLLISIVICVPSGKTGKIISWRSMIWPPLYRSIILILFCSTLVICRVPR